MDDIVVTTQRIDRNDDSLDESENDCEFYSLSTNNIVHGWAQLVDQEVERRKTIDRNNGREEKWNDKDYEHGERLKIAKECQHGILYSGVGQATDFDGSVFDIDHCMWGIVNSLKTVFLSLQWNVWKWQADEIEYVWGYFGAGYVADQACEYMTENSSRNVSKWPKLRSTGLTCKLALNSFSYVIAVASEIALHKEEKSRKKGKEPNYVPTLILSVMWVVIRLMRRAFGVLFTHKIPKTRDGTRPPSIQRMIDYVRLATFITYNLASVFVCCLSLVCFAVVYVWFV